MKILVTGAGGFLGKRIVERLLAHGEQDVRAMLRDTTKGTAVRAIAAAYPEAEVELFRADLKQGQEIAGALQGVELVIHAAAALKGSPAEMFLDSVVASRKLLEGIVAVAAEKRPRIVLVSSFGTMGVAGLARGAVVDETVAMETRPHERDVYSHTKLRQEALFLEYRDRFALDLVILRPGVIYGPGSGHLSNRVGLSLFGRFVHLGGSNVLPLTYVDNCAEAIVIAALASGASGEIYHVVDDDLLTSREYLKLYRSRVKPLRSVSVPFWLLAWGSAWLERYSERSKGQLPAIFTRYKTRTMWGGNQFTNAKLKGLGWRPIVSTREGLERTFLAFHEEQESLKQA